jgi:hypothetical protein
MVTRDKLTAEQWQAVRNAPHHGVIAVSSVGGSAFDDMLERSAGLQGIVDAINATHPLVSEIAGSVHIMNAQDEVRQWYYTLEEPRRTPQTLQDKALDTARHALEALGNHGTAEDLLHYSEFVRSLAMRVARAAREGDLFGIGGELVSGGERAFLEQLDRLIEQRRAPQAIA